MHVLRCVSPVENTDHQSLLAIVCRHGRISVSVAGHSCASLLVINGVFAMLFELYGAFFNVHRIRVAKSVIPCAYVQVVLIAVRLQFAQPQHAHFVCNSLTISHKVMVIFGAQRTSMTLCVRGAVMCNTVSACGCRRPCTLMAQICVS